MRNSLAIIAAAAMTITGAAACFAPAEAMPNITSGAALQSGSTSIEKVARRGGGQRWIRGGNRGGQHFSSRGTRFYGNRGGRFYGHRGGGRHYAYRGHRHRGHYGGFYPGLGIGLGLGFGAGYYSGYGDYYGDYYGPAYYPSYTTYGGGPGWKEACARRYRSFDWASGTYLGYDGSRHLCRL